ncbi:MAG: hypothetical protein ACRDZ7_01550 [Acidimicrobiia bacterium]
MTYIAETYENFTDKATDFKWGIDTNGDEGFDLIVFAEWEETELAAGLEDADENPVAGAIVSRPAPNTIQVAFPVSVLEGATSYRYAVAAIEDLNGNGESDPGEQDIAPDTGLYQHRLVSAPEVPAPAGGSVTTPVVAPKPVTAPAPLPAPSPAPAPAPVAGIDAPRTPAAAAPAAPAPVPVPDSIVRPAPRVAAGAASPEAVTEAAAPAPVTPAPAEAPPIALARTGAADRLLALLAGLALVLAGFMFFAETLIPRARPSA